MKDFRHLPPLQVLLFSFQNTLYYYNIIYNKYGFQKKGKGMTFLKYNKKALKSAFLLYKVFLL
jgi:hypothetical protein